MVLFQQAKPNKDCAWCPFNELCILDEDGRQDENENLLYQTRKATSISPANFLVTYFIRDAITNANKPNKYEYQTRGHHRGPRRQQPCP